MHPLLKNTQVNKTTFRWIKHGGEFRLSGYYYVYNTKDGERIFACVNKNCANAVSGVGVCGIILMVEDVEFLPRISKYGHKENRKRMIDQDRWKYHFLKSLPLGLTKRQVDNRSMKKILDEMFPKK